MDNQRPELDLKYFKDICPDKSGMFSLIVDNLWDWLTSLP